MTERISRASLLYEIAELWAKRSTCPRAQVGVIAVRDGRPIASGYNGAPSGEPHCTEVGCTPGTDKEYKPGRCLRTVHAEAALISFCAKIGTALEGAELWATHSPCPECAKLILNTGIVAVHFRQLYEPYDGPFMLARRGIQIFEAGEQWTRL